MKNGKLQVGIIGCGGIANSKHLPSLKSQSKKCDMVAFCDIVPDRAEKACEKYGVPGAKVYTDYKELLKDPEIDVVHVLTHNLAHCEITVAAFEAGKNVMCEKPMAASSADAGKMIDAWKKSGKKFTIGYQNRFRPEIQNLKAACEAGELGDIYYGKAHAVRRRAVPTWGVFQDKSKQGGGPLIDIGTHALDLTLWCMNNYEPVTVSGQVFYKMGRRQDAVDGNLWGPWDPEKYEVEDSAMGFIRMKNGALINIEASWAINLSESREASTTLVGTLKGAEVYSGNSYPQDKIVYNRGSHGLLLDETIAGAGHIAFQNEAEDGDISGDASLGPAMKECEQWLNCILNDTDPVVMPEQAFAVTQILEAIYKSAECGKEITL